MITIEHIPELARMETIRQQLFPDSQHQRLSAGYEEDLFHSGLVALNANAEAVGMACLYHPTDLQWNGKKAWALGNFEWKANQYDASLLFASAESLARQQDAEVLLGPMNGSTWKSYRFRDQSGNDVPFFAGEKVHEEYYNDLWKHYFPERFEYYSSIDINLSTTPILSDDQRNILTERISVRPLNLDQWSEELNSLYAFNLRAFQRNFLFTPIRRNAFREQYQAVRSLIDPKFTLLAEDKGKLVGFIFAYPDFNDASGKTMILKTVARDPAPEYRGVGSLLGHDLIENMKEAGYSAAIHAFIYGEGSSTAHSKAMGSSVYCTYSLYAKVLI